VWRGCLGQFLARLAGLSFVADGWIASTSSLKGV